MKKTSLTLLLLLINALLLLNVGASLPRGTGLALEQLENRRLAGEDPFTVNVTVSNLRVQQVYLTAFFKSSHSLVDSTTSAGGAFYFTFSADQHPGTYRIYFGRPNFSGSNREESPFIEFIWNRESFSIYADARDITGTVSFENSSENEVLGLFRDYENRYEEKMGAMYPLMDRYPEQDNFFNQASGHFLDMQVKRDEFITQLTAGHPDLYASSLIASYRSLILQPGLRGAERMEYLRYHFFDRAPIERPDLLYSPVYNYKIIEYLSLYRNQNNSFTQQEDAFIEAVDVIMANVSADPDLRSFVVEYLLEGFNSFNMERVQTYIADNYVDETCATEAVDLALRRVEGYRKMEIGQVASEFRVESIDNGTITTGTGKSDYTVVIFWSVDCEHCLRMMPMLKDWYLSERPDNIEVIAISLDTLKTGWTDYVKKMELPWINANEPLGWDGKSAADYNVYATPTIFILDRNRVIRAKPLTFPQLRRDVADLVGGLVSSH